MAETEAVVPKPVAKVQDKDVVEALRQGAMLRDLATAKEELQRALAAERAETKSLRSLVEQFKAELKRYDQVDASRILTAADEAWLRKNEGTIQYRKINGILEVEVSSRGQTFKAIRSSARDAMHFARMPERTQRENLK